MVATGLPAEWRRGDRAPSEKMIRDSNYHGEAVRKLVRLRHLERDAFVGE
jgi:hypothetical protein